jgi:hypothetical protein
MAKTAQAVIETKVKDGASVGFQKMQREMNKTAKQGKVLNQQFRFMRGGLGQVGHQVQDVAVQLQMGQNAMLVFGQQGSQIASLFGPGGAMFGAVIAIGAALSMSLAPAFFGATEAAKELKDANKDLIDSFDDLSPAQQSFAKILAQEKLAEYTAELDRLNKVSRERLTILETGSFFERFGAKKGDLESITDYNKRIAKLDSDIAFFEAAQASLKEKVDDTTTAFQKQDDALKKQIATFGKEGHALRVAGIEADLAAGKIKDGEDLKLIARSQTLAQLEMDAEREKQLAKDVAAEQAAAMKEAEQAMKAQDKTAQQFATSIGNGFVAAITGAKNFKDAMKDVAASVINDLTRMMVKKMIVDQLFGAVTNIMNPGGVIGVEESHAGFIGPLQNHEGGGFTGFGARSGGVDGKGGFPAILHPNETVIDHTKGQSMGGVVVNQTINVTTGVQQTVRAEIQNLMPQIAESAKSAVSDSAIRGGTFAKTMRTY